MTRAEFAEMLADLIAKGKITLAEAASLAHRMDIGGIVTASTPVPLKSLPGTLTKAELQSALRAASVRLEPADGKRLLDSGERKVITSTPPEVKQFLRERLRNHFRGDYEARMRSYAVGLHGGGNVAGWHAAMVREQRAYIARQMTAGVGRALAADEIKEVNRLSVLQNGYLQGFANEVSARRLLGRDFSLKYLVNRSLQYGGMGWGAWFKGNEIVEAKGDGYVVEYIAVDDPRTCGPCHEAAANGPYLPGKAPAPGEVCRGHGLCRCRTRVVFDMEAWKRLKGESNRPDLAARLEADRLIREQQRLDRERRKAAKALKLAAPAPAKAPEVPKSAPVYRPAFFAELDRFMGEAVANTDTVFEMQRALRSSKVTSAELDKLRAFVTERLAALSLEQRAIKTHGLSEPVTMNGALIDGVEFRWEDTAKSQKAAVNTLSNLYIEGLLGRQLPDALWKANRAIYFTDRKNADDAKFAELYKMPLFESSATGGDGDIMIYNGAPVSLGTLAHESAHNFANNLYGKVNPLFVRFEGALRPTSWAEAMADEEPVSDYAKAAPEEDFAESFQAYVTKRDAFKESNPKRFAEVERLLSGEGPIRGVATDDRPLSPATLRASSPDALYKKAIAGARDEVAAIIDAERARLDLEHLAPAVARTKEELEELEREKAERKKAYRKAYHAAFVAKKEAEIARLSAERDAEAKRLAEETARLEAERKEAERKAAEAAKVEAERIRKLEEKKAYRKAYHEAWKAKKAGGGDADLVPAKMLRPVGTIAAEIAVIDAEVFRIREKRKRGESDTPAEKAFMDTRRKELDILWAEKKRSEEEDEALKTAKPDPKGTAPKKYRHVLSLESEVTSIELEVGRLGRKSRRGEVLTKEDLDFLATADRRMIDLRRERDLSAAEDKTRVASSAPTRLKAVSSDVKLTTRPPQRKIDEFAARIRDDIRIQGVDPDEAVRALKEILDSAKPVINTKAELMTFWRSGEARFKSQFETGTSMGANNQTLRARAENKGLGFSSNPDVERSQRPIYGAMGIKGNRAGSYGGGARLTWTIKESARARMTITVGDSLYPMDSDSVLGTPLVDPGLEGIGSSLMTGSFLSYVRSKRTQADKEDLMSRIGYIEWQCQGQLTIDDVESVEDHSRSLSASDVKWLEDRGVKVIR